jgi:uncharacterized protein (DUF849 family)
MIVQACLNGARRVGFHPRLPLSAGDIAADGAACLAAGASELHFHARGPDGRESLMAVDAAVLAVRRTCPGALIGVSTGAWIEADEARTREAIANWRELPDYASVNLSEPDAPAVVAMLRSRGVAIEAGLSTPADAERLVQLSLGAQVLRVLIEVEDQDAAQAREAADAIAGVLDRASLRKPRLLHGFGAAVWPLIALAHERRWSTRVGLEDTDRLPTGERTPDNATLVAAGVAILRARRRR